VTYEEFKFFGTPFPWQEHECPFSSVVMSEIPRHRVKPSRTRPWKPDPDFQTFFDNEFLKDKDSDKFREEFSWPSKDDVSILQSLRYHASRREQVRVGLKEPNARELKRVIGKVEELYGSRKADVEKQLSPETFFEALRDVDMNSSPGWPWKKWYKNNREMLFDEEGDLNMANVYDLYDAVEERLKDLETRPCADDINVFVKDELHKQSKVESGAFRLISSVSLTDSMVDRVLFGGFFDNCYTPEGFSTTPNKAGWTPYLGGYKWLAKKYRKGKTLFADKSSWDWTMMPWVAYMLMTVMVRVCGDTETRKRQIEHRMMALFGRPNFNVGGWLRFTQTLVGLMKSGCLGTIVWNGMAQVALHLLAELRRINDFGDVPDTIGDDTLQKAMEDLEDYIRELNAAGCLARDYHVAELSTGGLLDFAGHFFNHDYSVPAYTKKHVGCLYESSDFKLEQLESYLRLYAFDPEMYKRVSAWVNKLGGRVYSREYMIDWYNGDHEETFRYEDIYG